MPGVDESRVLERAVRSSGLSGKSGARSPARTERPRTQRPHDIGHVADRATACDAFAAARRCRASRSDDDSAVTRTILLTGEDLTLADVWDASLGGAPEVSETAKIRMRAARELVDSIRGEHTYGVNTGFGRFVSTQIPEQ